VRQLQQENESLLRSELQVNVGRRKGGRRLRLLLASFLIAAPLSAQAPDDGFAALLAGLKDASFLDKEAIAERVLGSAHPAALPTMTGWLEDRLYVRQQDGAVVLVKTADESLPAMELIDPASQQPAGAAGAGRPDQDWHEQPLAPLLRTALARYALANPDRSVRLSAVTEMLRSLDDASVELLRQRAAEETDAAVKYQIETGLALAALDGSDHNERLAAIETLGNRLGTDVRNRLAALAERASDGSSGEADAEVRHAGGRRAGPHRSVTQPVRRHRDAVLRLEPRLGARARRHRPRHHVRGDGRHQHGARRADDARRLHDLRRPGTDARRHRLVDCGGRSGGVPGGGCGGIVLERTVIRFLYGRPLETLLATFGVSLLLQQLVRSVFSANNRAVATPAWLSGTWQINEALSLTFNRLYIVVFTLIVFAS
jgi:urea transport system permease protein